MKRFITAVFFITSSLAAFGQNWTTVTAANITDLNQQKLAVGQVCFLITDQLDNPISVQVGGGGQVLRRPFCSAVANGAVTAFTVPNPAATVPSGIYYRITVKDTNSSAEVLRYIQVTFSGATFNLDNFAPANLGNLAPLTGNAVSGNLSVAGNLSVTGSVTGSNIPAGIPGAGSCANQFVTALNVAAAPTCSNSIAGAFVINGSANLAASGAGGQTAGGFATPSAIRHYCGDGTGWRCEFAKRVAGVDTLEAWITDTGAINAVSGFQVNGAALNFSNLAGTAALATQVSGTLGLANGGTGQTTAAAAFNALSPMTTLGDLVFASGANTASRLAGNATTTKKYLSQTGTGTVSAAPAWAQIAAADLSDGNTGTGTIVHATSPSIATPAIAGGSFSGSQTGMSISSPVITSATFNTGVSQGSAIKHQRFGAACTTAASAGATCFTTYSWTAPFADANYTPICTGVGPQNGTAIWSIQNFTAASVTVILTSNGLASTYVGFYCFAIHD